MRHQRHLVARVPRDIKLQIIRDDLRARRFKYIRAVREYNQQVHDIMQAATKLKLAMKVTSLLISNKDDVRAAQRSAAQRSAAQCSAVQCRYSVWLWLSHALQEPSEGRAAVDAEPDVVLPPRPKYNVLISEDAMRQLVERGLELMHTASVGWVGGR